MKQQAARRPAAATDAFPWKWALLVVTVTAIVLSPVTGNGFTNWDDEYYILQNPMLSGPDWQGILTEPVVSNYHPLTMASYALNYAISGTDAWSYHLLNLLLHLVNTLLVFFLAWRLSGKKLVVAMVTAAIFGFHPMHVESVAWASERKDVLYTLFFLLSLIHYDKFLQNSRQIFYMTSMLFFTFSLLSKPAAIILPGVLLLMDYWHGRKFSLKLIREKIPFLILSLVFVIITLRLQSATAMINLEAYPLWLRALLACHVVIIYLLRFFIPYPLSAYHPFPPPGDPGWQVYAAPFLLLLILFSLWRSRNNRLVIFSFLFFLVNIVLVLQLIPVGFTLVAERYTYLAYTGIAFLAGHLAAYFAGSRKMLTAGVTFTVLALLAFVSFGRTRVWKNSDTLWSDVIRHYPDEPLPRADRAQYLYNQAIAMQGDDAMALYRRVIEDCTAAINSQEDPLNPHAKKGGAALYNMRGTSYYFLNDISSALNDFNISASLEPANAEIINFRGTIYFNHARDYQAALDDFTRSVSIRPAPDNLMNRSRAYYMLGNTDAARQDAIHALEMGGTAPQDYLELLQLQQ